ncbi:uncharacterized protein LOC115883772 [Sitophilus oryzae]|uniref:DNA-directed DNA polymerase n=1 Tax=Sitophilus oryzae TaxID=7048 RepID=A0A6J2Y2V4_SITOR|nr:uncharacterized protein LOC115883772 [Sitophilus oryzae]
MKWVKGAVEDILKKGTEGIGPNDQVGFNFCSKDFARGDGWINFKTASEVTFDDVWKMISGIYQSNSTGLNTETFYCDSKQSNLYRCIQSAVIINNITKNNLCLPRALVVAIAHADKDPIYTKIRKDTGKIQTEKTRLLMEAVGVNIPAEGAGIPELQKFQQYLVDYQIIVYQYGSKGRDLVFKGEEKNEKAPPTGNKFKDVVVLAHNGGGFDHQFILDHVLQQTDLTPELITRGTKLVLMVVGNVKFLDSLNYFPMALAKLPKAFGLTELKKGYFPHLFNTVGHQKYVGPMPAIEYYDPDNMKTEDREKFIKWYQERVAENYMFDFEKEFIEYCVSDVDILTQASLKFRKLMIDEGNVCPFTEASTLPSTCNKIFRRNFLQPETIGIIPKNGYRLCDNQSKIALQWLLWKEQERGVEIVHAAKQQERGVKSWYKVDGYCKETKQVFEFHGCYYHGCPRCHKYERQVPLKDDPTQTLDSRYENTITKTQHLTGQGYEVIEMWECDFRRDMDDEIKQYTEDHPLLVNLPLNPRDAFYGGRTENMKTYYKCRDGEQIKYVDVCSLYPWVNKYGKYPIGHPEVTFGFVLCYTCAKVGAKECRHSDEERTISGTWVIDEVVKALEKGYIILDIQEIWKYKEGVTLNPEKVSVNPGLRQLGKAVITSFWGKLCQRENQGKTSIVNRPEVLFSMLSNPATDVNSIVPVNDDTLLVNWVFKDEAYDVLPTVNVCLAAYTTAQARLKLYSYLEKVGDNAIYTDTDSVIYLSKAGQEDIPLGNFLGEMTDELEGYGEGSYIDEFVSGGPKNYAYKVYSPKSGEYSITCKVKGLSLNYNASQTIQFETIYLINPFFSRKAQPIPNIHADTRTGITIQEHISSYDKLQFITDIINCSNFG